MLDLDQILNSSALVFSKSADICKVFLPVLFLGRASYLGVLSGNTDSFWDLFKGTVLFFILITAFREILSFILQLPQSFKIAQLGTVQERYEALSRDGIGILDQVPTIVRWGLGWLTIILFYIAHTIYGFLVLLIAGIAPFVFLLSCVLQITSGTSTLFSFLIVVSIWPLIWQGFDAVASSIQFQNNSFGSYFVLLVSEVCKLFSPVFISKFLYAPSQYIPNSLGLVKSSGTKAYVAYKISKQAFGKEKPKKKYYSRYK